VIDLGSKTVVATVPLGKRPRGVRVSPDGSFLYVALSGSPFAPPGVDEKTLPPPDRSADGIGVVDVSTLKLLRVMPVGTDPEQLAVSNDGRRLFVSNEDAAHRQRRGGRGRRIVATVKVGGEPEGVEVSPDGPCVRDVGEDGLVFAIDSAKATLIRKFATRHARGRSRSSPTGPAPTSRARTGTRWRWWTRRKHAPLKTIALTYENARPMGIVAAPDGRFVYVTTGRGRGGRDRHRDGQVRGGDRGRPASWGMRFRATESRCTRRTVRRTDVSIVNVAQRTVVERIKVGDSPWGVALGADASLFLMAGRPSHNLFC
jgi:DNA-binding beta-propeller fold protein YncE